MQDQNAAAVADRFMLRANATGTGDPNSMQNLNTNFLPSGAMCFVTGTATMYYLDKAATVGGIAPGTGPGRWNVFSVAEAASGVAGVIGNAFNAFTPNDMWGISTNSGFLLDALTGSDWALTALGGVLTYSGQTRNFLVTLTASAEVANVSAVRGVFLGIAKNGDLVGLTPASGGPKSMEQGMSIASTPYMMSTSRIVSLTAADTLSAVMAGPAAAVSLGATTIMNVTPA